MESKNISQAIFVVAALVVAIYAAFAILLNPTGGISGLSMLITIGGVLLGIINPKAALYFLAAQSIYSDEIKRIGVFYGVTSDQTISEILVGPLLTICAINASFLYGVLRSNYHIGKLGWGLYSVIPLVAIGIILGQGGISGLFGGGFKLTLYLAGTASLYMTLVPVCYGLFRTHDEWVEFISWQVVVAAPAAAWGIWQYYNGFNVIEWTYARSGLSRVHSNQMLNFPYPRIFGMFGSESAIGCTGIYGAFSFWRGIRYKKKRLIFLAIALVYLAAIILSQQRSLLLYPLIILSFTFAFRHRITTVGIYSSVLSLFILGIINSTYMLQEGLEKINRAIAIKGSWGERVFNVDTFSDRLRGWERLSKADSWSLFGTGLSGGVELAGTKYDADYNHDIINKILINFGAVPLFFGIVLAFSLLYQLHAVIHRSGDRQFRNDGAFAMACIVPVLILSSIAGDNFTTTPINLQIWSVFAGIFILKRILEEQRKTIHANVPPASHPNNKTTNRLQPPRRPLAN